MEKKCSKCEHTFTCTNETSGCWCETVYLAPPTLQYLKENFDNCLCPNCLKQFENSAALAADQSSER